MTTSPTLRQLEALRAVYEHRQKFDRAPTYRELGRVLGIRSTNGVNELLRLLEKRGCLERDAVLSRSMRVTKLGMRFLGEHLRRCHSCGAEVAA